jgi:hypothetical protein
LAALKCAEDNDPVAEYLLGLTEAKRFTAISLFMNDEDKTGKYSYISLCLTRINQNMF